MTERVGRYAVLRKLATGGMAEVFLARAEGPDGFAKQVVLKRILPELARAPGFGEMFLREAQLAATFDHPNLAHVYDFGHAEGVPYLTMEYVDGPTLRQVRKRAQAQGWLLPIEVVATLVARACEGLHYLHELKRQESGDPMGLVHRDISPDNLMVSRSGIVKVLDFGITKDPKAESTTRSGTVRGKLPYMAPEQLGDDPLDRRVDVWALGIVLYELLALRRPYLATGEPSIMRAILFEPFTPIRQVRADVPEALAAIIDGCLQKRREERVPTARALQEHLEGFVSSTGPALSSYDLSSFLTDLAEGRQPRGRGSMQLGELSDPVGAAGVVPAMQVRPPDGGRADAGTAPHRGLIAAPSAPARPGLTPEAATVQVPPVMLPGRGPPTEPVPAIAPAAGPVSVRTNAVTAPSAPPTVTTAGAMRATDAAPPPVPGPAALSRAGWRPLVALAALALLIVGGVASLRASSGARVSPGGNGLAVLPPDGAPDTAEPSGAWTGTSTGPFGANAPAALQPSSPGAPGSTEPSGARTGTPTGTSGANAPAALQPSSPGIPGSTEPSGRQPPSLVAGTRGSGPDASLGDGAGRGDVARQRPSSGPPPVATADTAQRPPPRMPRGADVPAAPAEVPGLSPPRPSTPAPGASAVPIEVRVLPEGEVRFDGGTLPARAGPGVHTLFFVNKRFGAMTRPVTLEPCDGRYLIGYSFQSDKLTVMCRPR